LDIYTKHGSKKDPLVWCFMPIPMQNLSNALHKHITHLKVAICNYIITNDYSYIVQLLTIANVPSSENDDSVSSVVSGAVIVGTMSLIIIIIIIISLVAIMILHRREKPRRAHDIDDDDITIKPNPQQYAHITAGQSQHDHTDSGRLSQGAKVDPSSRLKTVNALYIPTKVKSLDSLLKHDHGCDVIITPNPSYATSRLQTTEKFNLKYDYVQIDDESNQHDKFGYLQLVGSSTSQGEATDPASKDNVNIDTNPSYSLPQDDQDVKLEDNPSYDKLQL